MFHQYCVIRFWFSWNCVHKCLSRVWCHKPQTTFHQEGGHQDLHGSWQSQCHADWLDEPSKKPAFLETYLKVKKDGHGKTLKPLLVEYTREMQERTSHGVEAEEGLFYAAKLLSLNGISWQDCDGDDKALLVARQLARVNADENGHDYRAQVWRQAVAFR